MNVKSIFHRLRGHKHVYQFYTTVTNTTSKRCLKLHGNLYFSKVDVPEQKLDCNYQLLRSNIFELSRIEQRSQRMIEKAQQELVRRNTFQQAIEALKQGDQERALQLFEQSAENDLFVSELEQLVDRDDIDLPPELTARLKEIFVNGYQEKFAKQKYERLPSRMRRAREEAGVARIKELLGD